MEATGGVVGEGGGGSCALISYVCVCVCVCVCLGKVCRNVGCRGGLLLLAGSWILSGVHQGSLRVRVNGFKKKCAQEDPR